MHTRSLMASRDKMKKHTWSKVEDVKLVEALLHLVETGWRADNGTFNPGYLHQLQHLLNVPNNDIGLSMMRNLSVNRKYTGQVII